MRMIRASAFFSTSIIFVLAACVGDSPTTPPTTDGGSNDTGSGNDSGCASSCNGATLKSCGGAPDQVCALGCIATPAPHCGVLQPASPVTDADLSATNVDDVVVSTLRLIHTDTGAIDGVRAANKDPSTYEVISGIGFKQFVGVNIGVFTVKSFTINDATSADVTGAPGLAIVSKGDVKILGTLDARGWSAANLLCAKAGPDSAGPGGTEGGLFAGGKGPGAGAGNGADISGGGGGGYGGIGGDGAVRVGEQPPDAKGGVTVPFALPIRGGFGGGSNGAGGGGGGGGAVQIVSGTTIQIGGGGTTGGINVGGCGGFGGENVSSPMDGGGGGGSGGMILLQAPTVALLAKGVLAANGGAGGSGGGYGLPGSLSDQAAKPQVVNGTSTKGPGGNGAAGSSLNGAPPPSGASTFGGGGGGAVGYIRIDTAAGTTTVPAGAIVSPTLGSSAATTTKLVVK